VVSNPLGTCQHWIGQPDGQQSLPHGKSGEISEIRIHNAAPVLTSAAWRRERRPVLDPQCRTTAADVAIKHHVIMDIGARSPTEPTGIAGFIRVVRQKCHMFGEIKRVAGGVKCGEADCSIPGRLAYGIADRLSASGREAAHGMSSESSGHNVASRGFGKQSERGLACHSITA